jgi:hypothetical protein
MGRRLPSGVRLEGGSYVLGPFIQASNLVMDYRVPWASSGVMASWWSVEVSLVVVWFAEGGLAIRAQGETQKGIPWRCWWGSGGFGNHARCDWFGCVSVVA